VTSVERRATLFRVTLARPTDQGVVSDHEGNSHVGAIDGEATPRAIEIERFLIHEFECFVQSQDSIWRRDDEIDDTSRMRRRRNEQRRIRFVTRIVAIRRHLDVAERDACAARQIRTSDLQPGASPC